MKWLIEILGFPGIAGSGLLLIFVVFIWLGFRGTFDTEEERKEFIQATFAFWALSMSFLVAYILG